MNAPTSATKRLMSLDALRGFDMFWIIGGGQLIREIARISNWKIANGLGDQMHHVEWAGFHFYDLIFPLFMFLAGTSIPFSISSKLKTGTPRKRLALKICRRALVLVSLGIVYNGFLDFNFSDLRYASVLGQIGLAYGIAAGIVLFSRKSSTPILWCMGILIIYGVLQLFVPVPGHGAGVLTREGCINGYIDRILLPGRLYGGSFDPEGLLCIISSAAIVLLGSQAGSILRKEDLTGYHKTALLVGISLSLLAVGAFISPFYPSIKSVWTTTFNLFAGGISFLILSLFYLVIDVWKLKRWAFFFRIIGLNSITIYMAVRIINFRYTSDFLFRGAAGLFGEYKPLVLIIGMIAVQWLFLLFLYRKDIFLKV